MSTLKVIAREVKTAPNSKNLNGQPRKMAVLTLSKPTVSLEVDPITGEEYQKLSVPLTAKVTQFLEEGTSSSGKKLGIDSFAEAQVGQRIEGDIKRLPVNPYTSTNPETGAIKEYSNIIRAFLGDTSYEGFDERVDKAIEDHNAQMVSQGRVAATHEQAFAE